MGLVGPLLYVLEHAITHIYTHAYGHQTQAKGGIGFHSTSVAAAWNVIGLRRLRLFVCVGLAGKTLCKYSRVLPHFHFTSQALFVSIGCRRG